MNPSKRIPLIVLGMMLSHSALAQQPSITNAQVSSRSAAAGLNREFQALVSGHKAPAWAGYAVPIISRDHRMCCNDGCCGGCRLEEKGQGTSRPAENSTIKLEGGSNLVVLFRFEQGQVRKIRSFSEECELDAGGMPVFWFTDVDPSESVKLLVAFVMSREAESSKESSANDAAIAAIAFHGDPSADNVLEQFTASGQPEFVRERTSFWLGAARGHRGYEMLRRMVREDPNERVREKVVFALSLSKEPEALSTLIETARGDSSAHVREQALFWLSQKAGKKAEEAITAAIDNDPETDVKKKAVFALSQLPKDEGVPRLIQVAKSNKNPAVRKQAIFWLGQSQDPRALAFFQEILR